ncbi:MAG TPA: hypothetical protein VIK85_06545 [Coriobacteriia bacterium]
MSEETVAPAPGRTHRATALLRETTWDIAIGLFWAALIVAIVLFSGVATQFAYVDF